MMRVQATPPADLIPAATATPIAAGTCPVCHRYLNIVCLNCSALSKVDDDAGLALRERKVSKHTGVTEIASANTR